MTEEHIPVPVHTPMDDLRQGHKIDVHADVGVEMRSHHGFMGKTGIVMAGLGAGAFTVAILILLYAFPDRWVSAAGVMYAEVVVAFGGVGLLLLMLGVVFFLYGRSVFGYSRMETIHTQQDVEVIYDE